MNPDQKPNQPGAGVNVDTSNGDEALAEVLRQYAPAEQQERDVQRVIEREEAALREALGHDADKQEGRS